jgi:O-antigen/teichoic acid export membrane protein/ubiquinone/menaquinone biosynthesis C-methylase UbiE
MTEIAGLTRVRRNTLFKILGESTRAFSVLLFILIARFLGGAEFGYFSVAMALATFFAGVADGGLNQLMIRDIARDRAKARERTELIFGIKIFMAPTFLLTLVAFMALCRYPPAMVRLGFYCGLAAASKSLLDYCFALFSGHEQMQYESVIKAINQVCALALGTWILVRHGGINAVVLTLAGVNAGTLLIAYVWLRQHREITPSKPIIDWRRWTELIKEAFPLTISILFSSLFIRIDVIMLSLFGRSASEIGQFAAGTRVIEALGTVPMLLTAALFPVMADHARNQPVLFGEMFKRWRLRFFGVAALATGCLILTRSILIRLTFGVQFSDTAHYLAILSLALPAIFLNYWYLSNLVIQEDQRTVAIATITALMVNIIGNLAVVSRWGATGISYSMVAAQFVMFCMAHARMRHFQRQIQVHRMATIKKDLTTFYQSSDAYYKHLDDHLDEQLGHFQLEPLNLSERAGKAHSILEVGCGSGVLLEHLKLQFPNTKMSGVDLSPIGVEMARQRLRAKNLEIEFRVADVETTKPFPDNSFDLVVCNEVLEHLTNPEVVIRHIGQMMAPGGILLLVFPNHSVRASWGLRFEKLWDTIRMMFDSDYLNPRFQTPPMDRIGADADATYISHPWEVQRMVKRAGLQIRYKSLMRGRLVAQK